jgi:uncharacterized protein (TIGR02600 family)
MRDLRRSLQQTGNSNGAALIIVLAMVVLLTGVIVGFLLNSTTEHVAAKSYRVSASTRLLADTVVNLIQAQINEATLQGVTYAWASQPGAIRLFDNNGSLCKIYRLYSAQSLVASGSPLSGTLLANDLPPASWTNSTALWVDLNASRKDSSGVAHYPIFDATKAANVDGFSINTGNTVGASTSKVPMPVRWLYVLQNGQILSPDSDSSGEKATFNNSSVQPSVTNPIVGRIAFWTDDETSKVNVNTAGGDGVMTTAGDPTPIANATYWSPPHFCAPDDVTLALCQPWAGEFQRYPGHPATVSLNNVLYGLGWNLGFTTGTPATMPTSGTAGGTPAFYNQYDISNGSTSITTPGITPWYAYGGSKGGNIKIPTTNTIPSIPLMPRPYNRLYSSVSELLFNYDRTASKINASDSTTRQQIETARFFLTAHSRAPEVNLFGQPRISMWPVWNSSSSRTAIDKLLSFSSTSSGNAYYFTRTNSTSCTADLNLSRNHTLLDYLDKLTSTTIPGYGLSFKSKYTQQGIRQILTEMFDYIRCINLSDTSTGATTYAASWSTASGASGWGCYQVAPTVNSSWNTIGLSSFPLLKEVAIQFVAMGQNTTALSKPLHSSYSSAQSALFIPGDTGTDNLSTVTLSSGSRVCPLGTRAVQAFLLLDFAVPAQMMINDTTGTNLGRVYPFCWVTVSGLNGLTLNGHSLKFPQKDAIIWGGYLSSIGATTSSWGELSFQGTLLNRTIGKGAIGTGGLINNTLDPVRRDPFYSGILPITINAANTMSFSGATITITVHMENLDPGSVTLPTSSTTDQTYTIQIPGGTFPLPDFGPTIAAHTLLSGSSTPGTASPPLIGMKNTMGVPSVDNWYNIEPPFGKAIINDGDVVESMVLSPSWSDLRMLAIKAVPQTAFTAHPNWGQQFAHNLFYSIGIPFNGNTTYGTLVSGATYSSYTMSTGTPEAYPTIPPISGSTNPALTGDWDNGLGSSQDGPWINKADEGSLLPSTSKAVPYYYTSGNYPGPTFFSPNRQVPSPGMFGSLPTGIDPTGSSPTPWRPLLFRPGPTGHLGATNPPDHLLLDLFWMPVAEPYAISEPFSTAGKINLNYQIVPFTYITRSTALRAVLASEKIAAIALDQSPLYKVNNRTATQSGGLGMTVNARYPIDLDVTLAQFDSKFSSGEIFRSASQICEMYLVPKGVPDAAKYTSAASFASDWYSTSGSNPLYAMVGDNVRERPYANIYGRITTKSNTFTVYYTVQSIKNTLPANQQNQWIETNGLVSGEYRGSTTLERFVDPGQSLPDFASLFSSSSTTTVESYYKWRVVENNQFVP